VRRRDAQRAIDEELARIYGTGVDDPRPSAATWRIG
jgi:hypothetical protein